MHISHASRYNIAFFLHRDYRHRYMYKIEIEYKAIYDDQFMLLAFVFFPEWELMSTFCAILLFGEIYNSFLLAYYLKNDLFR